MRYQLIMLEEINDSDTSESLSLKAYYVFEAKHDRQLPTYERLRGLKLLAPFRVKKTKGREVNECR